MWDRAEAPQESSTAGLRGAVGGHFRAGQSSGGARRRIASAGAGAGAEVAGVLG